MANAYKQLFGSGGVTGFALAGAVGRTALPMTGIGIITMLAQEHGNYTLAGGVAATFVLTYALLSPQLSRLVDRHGQAAVLRIASSICAVGFMILIAASHWQAPIWTLFAGAFLSGFMPSISAMVRARWTALHRGDPLLQTAYSLETVLDEVTFIAGPPLAVGLSMLLFPQAALAVALILLLLGVAGLVLQPGTEPALPMRGAIRLPSVIRLPTVRLLTLLLVSMGIVVGTVDISSVAYSGHLGQPGMASVVLAVYAAGSCIAGLAFGNLALNVPLHRLIVGAGFATAMATLALTMVNGILTFAIAVFVAGAFFAPTMIIAMTMVERAVPEAQLTEGLTWLLAGLNIGVAIGAAVAGQVVDDHGPEAAFGVAYCAAGAIALLSILSGRHMTVFLRKVKCDSWAG